MISSQSRIVVSRWAMIRHVQPATSQVVVNDPFGLRIQSAGGLVENQQAGITHQGAGNLESLSLSAGEISRLLGHVGVVAATTLEQVAMNGRIDASLHQAVRVHRLVPERQVVADRTLEEVDFGIDQTRPS